MTRKALLLLLLASTLSLAACFGDDDDPVGAQTVMALVASLTAASTDEVSTPIVLNDLPISDAGTDDTSLPAAVN